MTSQNPERPSDLPVAVVGLGPHEGTVPQLDCSNEVPALMERVVESGAERVRNAKGFYKYTPEQAEQWAGTSR